MLDGEFRTGHFDGVATVVATLRLQALPDIGVFNRRARPLLPKRVPDCRERGAAPTLFRCITQVASAVAAGTAPDAACAGAMDALELAGFGAVDYVNVRDAETLEAPHDASRPRRVLAAARVGRARLIENVPVPRPEPFPRP